MTGSRSFEKFLAISFLIYLFWLKFHEKSEISLIKILLSLIKILFSLIKIL